MLEKICTHKFICIKWIGRWKPRNVTYHPVSGESNVMMSWSFTNFVSSASTMWSNCHRCARSNAFAAGLGGEGSAIHIPWLCHVTWPNSFRCLLLAGWYIHSIQTTGWSCWGLVLSWHRTRLSCAKRSCSTQNIKTSMHMYINPQTAVAVVVWDITWKGSGIHASPDFEDTLVVYDEYVSRARVIPSYSYPVLSRWSPLVYTCIHSQGRTHT